MASFSTRLAEAIRSKNSVLCVGLDPRRESLPLEITARYPGRTADAYSAFCREVIDLVSPFVPVVKPQSAFFEVLGHAGVKALEEVIAHAREKNLLVILDAKRGDIATTGAAYAEAAFETIRADSLTVAPYMGEDSIEPFLEGAAKADAGLFVLLRTSNPGSGLFQNLLCDNKPLYHHVAGAINRWNKATLQSYGYGDIGAVVGATNPAELKELRALMPGVWFLVPGFGAQGGTAEDVRSAFDADGMGAIVNSSRGITFCYKPDAADWREAIVSAVESTNRSLNSVRN